MYSKLQISDFFTDPRKIYRGYDKLLKDTDTEVNRDGNCKYGELNGKDHCNYAQSHNIVTNCYQPITDETPVPYEFYTLYLDCTTKLGKHKLIHRNSSLKGIHNNIQPALCIHSNDNRVKTTIECYYDSGKLHRHGSPAIMEKGVIAGGINYDPYTNSTSTRWKYKYTVQIHYNHGVIHNDNDRPAYIKTQASNIYDSEKLVMYFKNGKLHRDNGYAVIKYVDDEIEFAIGYNNDQLHSPTDSQGTLLPAFLSPKGHRCYYTHGQMCNLKRDRDGYLLPTIIKSTGTKIWYTLTKDNVPIKHRDERDINGHQLPAVITAGGKSNKNYIELKWYINGKLDRIDDSGLPAHIITIQNYIVECTWYVQGKKHRDFKDENGHSLPAYINVARAIIKYYYYDLLHRDMTDGHPRPACIYNGFTCPIDEIAKCYGDAALLNNSHELHKILITFRLVTYEYYDYGCKLGVGCASPDEPVQNSEIQNSLFQTKKRRKGCIIHYRVINGNTKLHCPDGPALICEGQEKWYIAGSSYLGKLRKQELIKNKCVKRAKH